MVLARGSPCRVTFPASTYNSPFVNIVAIRVTLRKADDGAKQETQRHWRYVIKEPGRPAIVAT